MKTLGIYFLDGSHIHIGDKYGKLQTAQSITDELLRTVLSRLAAEVRQLSMEHENGVCLELEFGKRRECFIGLLYDEETIYYFNNGSGNREPRDLHVNVCPQERMLCYSTADTIQVVETFCRTGGRDDRYQWILDWSEDI